MRVIKRFALTVICAVFIPCTCYAATTADLYAEIDKPLITVYPDGVIDTIRAFDDYKRSALSNVFVIDDAAINSDIKRQVKDLKKTKKELESQLLNGYSLSYDDIAQLEIDYAETADKLEQLETLKSNPIEPTDIVSDVTYKDYLVALNTKNAYDNHPDLGSLDLRSMLQVHGVIPSTEADKLLLQDCDIITPCLFAGRVISTDNNCVIISHGDKIFTRCCNLEDIAVNCGDQLIQGQALGVSTGNTYYQISVDGSLINFDDLL